MATIMVVDDEPMVRNLLSQFLTLRGYRVRAAKDGPDALALLKQEHPQLIILDVYMPGMNGVDVLRQLRGHEYKGSVIALSASQDEQLLQEMLELGSVDIMGKPVDLERLAMMVEVSLVMKNE
ncbi:MAG: response regulator transcription factor [Nitrospiraceae bacterium]